MALRKISHRTSSNKLPPATSFPLGRYPPRLVVGVGSVAQAIAEEIEGKDGDDDAGDR
jgi:hypothetical protein